MSWDAAMTLERQQNADLIAQLRDEADALAQRADDALATGVVVVQEIEVSRLADLLVIAAAAIERAVP